MEKHVRDVAIGVVLGVVLGVVGSRLLQREAPGRFTFHQFLLLDTATGDSWHLPVVGHGDDGWRPVPRLTAAEWAAKEKAKEAAREERAKARASGGPPLPEGYEEVRPEDLTEEQRAWGREMVRRYQKNKPAVKLEPDGGTARPAPPPWDTPPTEAEAIPPGGGTTRPAPPRAPVPQ